MISCDKGQIEIEGYKPAIMAELTSLVHAFIGEQVLTEDEVDECIDLAKKSEEEIDDGIDSMIDKMSPEQLLRALIGTLEDISS